MVQPDQSVSLNKPKFLAGLNIAFVGQKFTNYRWLEMLEAIGKPIDYADLGEKTATDILLMDLQVAYITGAKFTPILKQFRKHHPKGLIIAVHGDARDIGMLNKRNIQSVSSKLHQKNIAAEVVKHIYKAYLLTGENLTLAQEFAAGRIRELTPNYS